MTDSDDQRVIERLRERVDRAGKLPFLTVDTRHLRILFARLDEARGVLQSFHTAEPRMDADTAAGIAAAALMQLFNATAPGDLI